MFLLLLFFMFFPGRLLRTIRKRTHKCVSETRTVRWARLAALAITVTRTTTPTGIAAERRRARENPSAVRLRRRPSCRRSWSATPGSSNGCGTAGK